MGPVTPGRCGWDPLRQTWQCHREGPSWSGEVGRGRGGICVTVCMVWVLRLGAGGLPTSRPPPLLPSRPPPLLRARQALRLGCWAQSCPRRAGCVGGLVC